MALAFMSQGTRKQKEQDQNLGITFKDAPSVTYFCQPGFQLFSVLQNPKIAHSRNKHSSHKPVGTLQIQSMPAHGGRRRV